MVRSVSLQLNAIYWDDLPKRLSLSETGSPAYTWTCLAQSPESEQKANIDCPGSLILEMPQASPSDMATRTLPFYFALITKVKFAYPHLQIILTKRACHHNSFWGSRCDSNHVHTVSLKLVHYHGDFGISFRLMTQVLSRHTSSQTSDHPRYFEPFRPYFRQNLHNSANPYQSKNFQACNSKYSKSKPKRPDVFN